MGLYDLPFPPLVIASFVKRLFIKKILISLLFLGGIIWPMIYAQKAWKCKEFTDDKSRLTIDCSFQELDFNIPDYLNPKVQVLNLSGNRLISLSNKSFEKYSDLIILDLSSSHQDNQKMEIGCFLPLHKLQILDLSGTCFPGSKRIVPHYYFRANLKIFKYEDCIFSRTIDLTDMIGIEELYAFNSGFRTFPIFNVSSRVRFVDLRNHELADLRVMDIAAYCRLKEVLLEIESGTGLQHSSKYCECAKIAKWFDLVKIVLRHKLNCTQPKTIPSDCDLETVDPEALEKRYNCLYTVSVLRRLIRWWPVFLLFLIIFGGLAALFFFASRRFKHQVRESEGEGNDDKEHESMHEEEEGKGHDNGKRNDSGSGKHYEEENHKESEHA